MVFVNPCSFAMPCFQYLILHSLEVYSVHLEMGFLYWVLAAEVVYVYDFIIAN